MTEKYSTAMWKVLGLIFGKLSGEIQLRMQSLGVYTFYEDCVPSS